MSVSSLKGMFGSRAAVAKPHLLAHYGCVQMTESAFLLFVWSFDLRMRKALLGIYLFEHSLVPLSI